RSFLNAFRRFIATRGVLQIVFSDNALTFQRASKDLEKLYASIKSSDCAEISCMRHIIWKFNVPRARWWGGFFERIVRSLKEATRRIIGTAHLSYDELCTVIFEIEALINSRPLYRESDNVGSVSAITLP